jgi:hypothetical protein
VRAPIALALTFVLIVAACGDSSDGLTSPTSPPTETTATIAAGATTTTAPGVPTMPAGGDSGALPPARCLEIGLALSQAASMGMFGSGSFEDSVLALEAMAGVAPPEIAADFALMASALDEFFRALTAAGIDMSDPSTMASPEAQQAYQDAAEGLEASGADAAADRIGDYLEEVCEG